MAKRKTIGVYTPYLQGFYFGELVSQLQQYCFLKGYAFTVIKTDSFGTFTSKMHSDRFDSVVILRNAIHSKLAQYLLEQGKAIVSVAYDYFPLAIPMVSSDNELGTELAFNYLLQKGHRDIAFVGDLSQYDIRKRYEAYCDQCEINDLEIKDGNVFVVEDTLFSGGYGAASRYLESQCAAKGIICGASLTSIGFSRHIELLSQKRSELDIVGFDAISLVPITDPLMAMVDQNLHLMAYKTLNILEGFFSDGDTFERHHLVEPKLITPQSDFMQAEDAFLATSTDLPELHNANYMKSVINNLEEWPKTIVESNLNSLMMLAPLFERYMQKACYGRTAVSKNGEEYVKVVKVFSPTHVTHIPKNDMKTLSEAAAYPVVAEHFVDPDLDTSVHLPIFQDDRLWSVISVYGASQKTKNPNSFSAFSAYLDNIANHLKLKIQKSLLPSLCEKALKDDDNASVASGTITWAGQRNEAQWDNDALVAIGLTSPLEQSIYRHMDLTDRIHPSDEDSLRECLVNAKEEAFSVNVRLKHKNKSYLPFQIERGEVKDNGELTLQLTLVNSVS
ncbi:MAG TPA: substrate-binding domain-containing protein [Marinagarivorans sp.]